MFKNKIFKFFSYLLFFTILISPISANSHPDNHRNQLYPLITSTVFKISVPNGSGTGFSVAPHYIITNYHVVKNTNIQEKDQEYYRQVSVDNFDGSLSFSGYVVFVDKKNDMALVWLNQGIPDYLPISTSSQLNPMTEVYAAGYPIGDRLILTRGYFQGPSTLSNYLSISAPIAPGNSGGPALFWDPVDKRYEVFGVASANLGSQMRSYSHLTLVRPCEPLTALLSPFLYR